MTFPDPSPLKKAVDDLKDIVSRSRGDDHEIAILVKKIEAIVASIETKTGNGVGSAPASAQTPTVVTVVQPTTPTIISPIV